MTTSNFFNQTFYRDTVIDWLKGKRITLWQTFNLQDDDGIQRAADWFINEQNQFSLHFSEELQATANQIDTFPAPKVGTRIALGNPTTGPYGSRLPPIRDWSSLYDGDGMNPPHRPTMFWGTSTPRPAQS